MSFYAAKNTVTQSVEPCAAPWEFVMTEKITEQVRKVKHDRQLFYQNPATQHNFYSGVEGHNPALRVSNDNPARAIHSIVADYDIPLSAERIDEAVAAMPIKPAWTETSLGGNARLVWLLERPLLTDGNDFAVFFLDGCTKWLNLNLLPSLDSQALISTSRLYCNGCVWRNLGHGPIPKATLQAFFVKLALKFRAKERAAVNIAIETVEKEIKTRFPSFNWPGEFVVGSQGPSWWIPESASPMSAIVKEDGMLTFSAHATKMFYGWGDLLGKEFVSKFETESMSAATEGVFYDGRKFHRVIDDKWTSAEKGEFVNYLEVTCKLSSKPDVSGNSAVKKALEHIYNHQRVVGAAPFVMKRPGLIIYQNDKVLNVYAGKPQEPAAGTQKFGPHGNLPFTTALLHSRFSPTEQFAYWMAWLKHYYQSAYFWLGNPGQNCTIQGGPGTGKTFINRQLIGGLVGGFADASKFVIENIKFNSHLLHVTHWVLDDDIPNASFAMSAQAYARIKKLAANQEFEYEKKFEVPCMVERTGRLGITANLDFQSSRIVGPLDDSSSDKMNLFRFIAHQKESEFQFPSDRAETIKYLRAELPFFARLLLDYEVPDYVPRDTIGRYGYASYHEPSLLDQSAQTSPSAPFKEILLDSLTQYFRENPEKSTWVGTVSQINRLILSNPLNSDILRSLKLDQTNRYLEQIEKEGLLKTKTVTDPATKTRVWTFWR